MEATVRIRIWGQISVVVDHAGFPSLVGSDLVALKMVNVVEIMARMMRLQLKFTPRSANLAIRTLVFTFCN